MEWILFSIIVISNSIGGNFVIHPTSDNSSTSQTLQKLDTEQSKAKSQVIEYNLKEYSALSGTRKLNNREKGKQISGIYHFDKSKGQPRRELSDNASRSPNKGFSTDCKQHEHTITCASIPTSVPTNLTSVIVTGTTEVYLTSHTFSHKSWSNVLTLQMKVLEVKTLESNCFAGLKSLLHLTVLCHHLHRVDQNSWSGLKALIKLELTGIHKLTIQQLGDALYKEKAMPLLEQFVVNPIYRMDQPAKLYMTDNFTDSLVMRPLKCFNTSNVVLSISVKSIVKIVLKVDYVNLTNSILYDLTITKLASLLYRHTNATELTETENYLLRSLDVSGLKAASANNVFVEKGAVNKANFFHSSNEAQESVEIRKCSTDTRTITSIENIYANNFDLINLRRKSAITCTGFHVKTKTLVVRRNNIAFLNVSIILDPDNALEVLDLSKNNMKYIFPTALGSLNNLQSLFLSNNQLNHMEYSNFSRLFNCLVQLQTLKLDNNHLSKIPTDMFQFNTKLQHLTLAGNYLDTVSFDLKSLKTLQTLDLQYNRIYYIDSAHVKLLDFYITMRKHSSSQDILIFLKHNPLECTCKASQFIEWYLKYASQSNNVSLLSMTCTFDGSSIDLNSNALKKCQFQCIKNTIIICTITIIVALLIAVLVALILYKHVRKKILRANWTQQFKKRFIEGTLEQKYIVFAAMSSNEEEFVMSDFIPLLQHNLQKHIKTQSNLICTGMDFKPGFPIVTEAQRLIKDSCVVVSMVSQAFCHSNYCRMEVQEACHQHKPVIMILLENIDVECMSPYLLEVFNRNTRATLVRTSHGQFDITPSLEVLADSIVCLAIDNANISDTSLQ